MADAQALFTLLRQTANPAVAKALEKSVESDPDRALNRINPLTYAAERGLDDEHTIGGFVHAAQLGLFDMSWNMLCPGCGGVLESGAALKTINHSHYSCSLCASDYEPTLDQLVEVTFTVNPRIRRIAAHDPDSLPFAEYMRQIFWSSSTNVPDDVESVVGNTTLDAMELAPGEKAAMSLSLPKGFAIVFDPVTHSSMFLEVASSLAPAQDREFVGAVTVRVKRPAGMKAAAASESSTTSGSLDARETKKAIETRSATTGTQGAWGTLSYRDDEGEKTFALVSATTVIGRGSAADVVIRNAREEVSRQHCRIRRDASGDTFLSDLGSSNGTQLDGLRLASNTESLLPDAASISLANGAVILNFARQKA